MATDHHRVQSRIASINQRLIELSDEWQYACSTDAQYRMVEAERDALKMERQRLCEIKGDLA